MSKLFFLFGVISRAYGKVLVFEYQCQNFFVTQLETLSGKQM